MKKSPEDTRSTRVKLYDYFYFRYCDDNTLTDWQNELFGRICDVLNYDRKF